MFKKVNIEQWLTFSHALFSDLMPLDLQHAFSDMTSSDHAALIDRQAAIVDAALVTSALAAGEPEVRQMFNSLGRETIIALCSQWCRYHAAWKKLGPCPEPPLWGPPDEKDLWRAVLLAMTNNAAAALAARDRLWPGSAGASCG